MQQELETLFVGGHERFADQMETPNGQFGYFGELGFQSDISDAGTAHAYALSDMTTLYSYDYETAGSDDDYSLSHSSLAFGASLARPDRWQLRSAIKLNHYRSGTITNLTLQASKTF